jgi:predicted acetyltransferase
MSLFLIKPSIHYENTYLEMLQDWARTNEQKVPFVLELDPSPFGAMIEKLEGYPKGIDVPDTFINHSTYWLVNNEEQIVGVVNIRHGLTDRTINIGGHIGYGIRPSDRKKGYATEILRLALDKANQLGIEKALVTCEKNNIGSAKTIQKNGGQLESEIEDQFGNIFQRYWVTTLN